MFYIEQITRELQYSIRNRQWKIVIYFFLISVRKWRTRQEKNHAFHSSVCSLNKKNYLKKSLPLMTPTRINHVSIALIRLVSLSYSSVVCSHQWLNVAWFIVTYSCFSRKAATYGATCGSCRNCFRTLRPLALRT